MPRRARDAIVELAALGALRHLAEDETNQGDDLVAAVERKLRVRSTRGDRRKGAPASPTRPVRLGNPSSGIEIADGLSIYHDAAGGEFAVIPGDSGCARFVIYQFLGSYLSVAAALATDHRRNLGPGRALMATLSVDSTRALTVFLRLNLQAGDERQTLYETIVVEAGKRVVSFDLDAIRLPFDQIGAVWLDVIFSEPEMTEILLRDISLEVAGRGRRPG